MPSTVKTVIRSRKSTGITPCSAPTASGSVLAVGNFLASRMQRPQQQERPEEVVEPARLAAFIAQATAKRAVSPIFSNSFAVCFQCLQGLIARKCSRRLGNHCDFHFCQRNTAVVFALIITPEKAVKLLVRTSKNGSQSCN
jgi:hypothetical protein